ncbi:MAG: PTS fructose transporter subunit IIA [Pelolinea sp.]|jgi:mannosylglycerate hydrolase|nr:PTS fructose transporter subunit IIA [Pelolinea sp.]
MGKKIIAHCIHHTHWDPFWYFTSQDSMVVFSYNMREMLRAFDAGKIKDFFLDGQTAAVDEYVEVHPEDETKIRQLVTQEKLIIGPFVSQLDPFLCSGESVINNLRLGIRHAQKLGKASLIAYLADPFGQSIDFPKIFNQFGIHDFVFTRGVGDIYGLGNEFFFESNDGSQVLCHTLLAGYGYGTYAFMDKTLFTGEAEDYNKIAVDGLIQRLLDRSTLSGEFVFPLGFDQNPIMLHIDELIAYYNQKFPDMEFRYTNWKEYFARVRGQGRGLKTFRSEINSPQYHRLHLSGMNSARADIKAILDKAERSLTYETQPLMAMLDSLGIPYDQGILDKAWYTLVNCQTHASATHVDATNRWMKENGLAALNYSEAAKIHLMRLVAVSLPPCPEGESAVVLFNTIPWERQVVARMTVISKKAHFRLLDQQQQTVAYSLLHQEMVYGGVVRKDESLMKEDKWFYKSEIVVDFGPLSGIGYRTFTVKETDEVAVIPASVQYASHSIHNERYVIEYVPEGIQITDKKIGKTWHSMLYLQDGGDAGDSYDYSYPDPEKELIIIDPFDHAYVECVQTPQFACMTLHGSVMIPESLDARADHLVHSPLGYTITFELNSASPVIRIHGTLLNQAKDHRVCLGVRTGLENQCSFAGTQFGYVQRACDPVEMKGWKEKGYFEEPCSTRPLLNHVSAVGEEYTLTVFTRSLKEYDFVNENFSDIQLTLFRSVGYVGLPDLNRRPGRPSGLANKIFAAPEQQMLGENFFDIGIGFYQKFDGNQIMRDYTEFAIDEMAYQNQTIDKTIYPIAYFPINRLEKTLPVNYQFMQVKNFLGSFGTLKKSEREDGFVLQIFNSEKKLLEGGELELGFDCAKILHVNLMEEMIGDAGRDPLSMKEGELKNMLLVLKRQEE